jgi:Ala-tRNA(Pro) deacylase
MLVERARRLLETDGVAFETLPHREAYTAQGVAAAAHVSGWMLAKVLVVRAPGEGPLMVVLPASCRLDLAALAHVLGKPSVSLVAESEMKELFPDCEIGAMPPFGQLYGLPVWVDAWPATTTRSCACGTRSTSGSRGPWSRTSAATEVDRGRRRRHRHALDRGVGLQGEAHLNQASAGDSSDIQARRQRDEGVVRPVLEVRVSEGRRGPSRPS